MSSLLCCDESKEDEWNAIIQGGDLFKIIKLETTSKEAKAFVMGVGLTASDIKVISWNGKTEVDVTLYGRMFVFQLVKTEDRKKTGLLFSTALALLETQLLEAQPIDVSTVAPPVVSNKCSGSPGTQASKVSFCSIDTVE
ncbi:hypothetical protein GCK72_004486 [Caenorhabditis remanei]|uniref:Uncharacterized protein n=1 Tax=Caenorhabditis remanei TaxID=31234 RepID=A0A6A5HBI7_CAERE|nr:hypothetical protein GCK72_004486 [Caenorhabditis remanei]KAF1764537.1 hypothetical protein GCK72_004486 [Caenorhabditis remanei]